MPARCKHRPRVDRDPLCPRNAVGVRCCPPAAIQSAYPDHVTELPIDDTAGLASAAHDAAERGQVVYLTDPQGRRIAAIVPASVAAAGTAAIEALEDAADLAVAQEALTEWDEDDRRTYRLVDVDAELSES
jgi:hypothetical protein